MKLKIKENTTSKMIRVFIQDSSVSDGSGLTGLVYNDTNLTCYYIKEGDASATQITLASATAGTWTSGGFVEVDSANMPGIYEIGLPDAAIDNTSEGSVLVYLFEKTTAVLNIVPVLVEIELDTIDYRSLSWQKLMLSAGQIYNGVVETAGFSATATQFETDIGRGHCRERV